MNKNEEIAKNIAKEILENLEFISELQERRKNSPAKNLAFNFVESLIIKELMKGEEASVDLQFERLTKLFNLKP